MLCLFILEQMDSDSAAPLEEDETEEEQGSSGSTFEDQVMVVFLWFLW